MEKIYCKLLNDLIYFCVLFNYEVRYFNDFTLTNVECAVILNVMVI